MVDIDLILKALGSIVAILLSLYQLRVTIKPKRRSTLMTDLEILEKLKKTEDKKNHDTVQKSVDKAIVKIYTPQKKWKWEELQKNLGNNWKDTIISTFFFLFFLILTVNLLKDGPTVLALITGFFALAGIGGILHSVLDDD